MLKQLHMTEQSSAGVTRQSDNPLFSLSENQTLTLGRVMQVMARSPAHLQLPLHHVLRLTALAITLDQIAVLPADNGPVGYATWAFLSAEARMKLSSGIFPALTPQGWRSGEEVWVIDTICSAGFQEDLMQMVKASVPSGRSVHLILHKPTKSELSIVKY
jgi:hemolysin-activating ACP:hemolysin acyltransferase